ncbi:hypothetical protein T484DRAFT_1786784, partial [Baffinella frigidus]
VTEMDKFSQEREDLQTELDALRHKAASLASDMAAKDVSAKAEATRSKAEAAAGAILSQELTHQDVSAKAEAAAGAILSQELTHQVCPPRWLLRGATDISAKAEAAASAILCQELAHQMESATTERDSLRARLARTEEDLTAKDAALFAESEARTSLEQEVVMQKSDNGTLAGRVKKLVEAQQ